MLTHISLPGERERERRVQCNHLSPPPASRRERKRVLIHRRAFIMEPRVRGGGALLFRSSPSISPHRPPTECKYRRQGRGNVKQCRSLSRECGVSSVVSIISLPLSASSRERERTVALYAINAAPLAASSNS